MLPTHSVGSKATDQVPATHPTSYQQVSASGIDRGRPLAWRSCRVPAPIAIALTVVAIHKGSASSGGRGNLSSELSTVRSLSANTQALLFLGRTGAAING